MIRKLIIESLVLTAVALPAAALAAENGLSGSITLGGAIVDVSNESFKFGEYTGLSDDSFYVIANADLSYETGPYYLDFRASNLGLDNRRGYAEAGRYGGYKLFAEYLETPKLISNNSKTIFDGAGGANLTLPAGFVTGAQTINFTNLADHRKDVELRLERKTGRVGFAHSIGNTDVSLSFERESKDGIKYIGGTLGISGGNTRSVGLPEPVDYTTNTLRFSAAHTADTAQVQFDYFLSTFDNENDSIIWEVPFTVATYPTVARTSLPPDNIHHRFSLSGGVDLPHYSRLSGVFEYGIMSQDEDLLPYSHNPLSTVTVPVPRQSADAQINTTHFALNLSSRPVRKLAVKAGYRFYKTDNRMDRTLFRYVKNDTAQPQEALASASALFSLPYDYTQNKLSMDASYHLFTATTLRVGFAHDIIDRDYREIETTRENTYKAALSSSYIPHTTVGVDYLKGMRRADDEYNESLLFDAYHTPEYIATLAADVQFDNHPLMRKFDIANRDRERYGANVTVFPTDMTTLAAYVNHAKDRYSDSVLGLQHSTTDSFTVDGSITPVDFATVYAFYTKEELESEQDSRSFSGAAVKAAQSADPNRNWSAFHDDDVDTFGVGTKLGFLENRLVFNADYTFSQSTSSIRFTAGSVIAVPPVPTDMPDLKTRLHTVNLKGRYMLSKNLSVGAGYQFEDYESDDWAVDNYEPASATIPNVLTLVGPVQDYEAHTGMVFLTYTL